MELVYSLTRIYVTAVVALQQISTTRKRSGPNERLE